MNACIVISMLYLLLGPCGTIWSQALEAGVEDALTVPSNPGAANLKETSPTYVLPEGFSGITLSSSVAEVQEQLKASQYFFYRGPEDVSFRPYSRDVIIDVRGLDFVERASFQFNSEEDLISILLHLDSDLLDYYTVYSTLRRRYREPQKVTPDQMVWNNGRITLLLEKPVTVKYLLTEWFTAETELEETDYAQKRSNFLKEF